MPAGDRGADEGTSTKAPVPVLAADGRRRVLVLWEGGSVSRPLEDDARLVLGRASSSDIPIPHTSVSRAHAVLYGGSPAQIEDLGSANGIKVDGIAIPSGRRVPAPVGVIVELGSAMLIIQDPRRSDVPRASSDRDEPTSTMARIHLLVDRLAASMIHVLLLGETGVGKGVLAEAIHRRSPRAKEPFLPLNCGALPESLLESELFGHERGAFTGAVADKPGLLEAADKGTVFLDEVGELPLGTQVRLLRALENNEVLRVGSRRPRTIDVRFVAATNRDLESLIASGDFREDLYYRLNGISIVVPPLRQRASEIVPLAESFAREACRRAGSGDPRLSRAVAEALRSYAWPGNVRELRNAVERALVVAGDAPIRPEHLSLRAAPLVPPRSPAPGPSPAAALGSAAVDRKGLHGEVEELERRRILEALERAGGNQTKAADLLGISRRTLLRRLDEYGVARPRKTDGGS